MSETEHPQTLALYCNTIAQVTVSNLLDGRYFFIPSYQRGYRWSKQQVYDLCNDLLEYILKAEKKDGSFYSLQPLIVRKGDYIINNQKREAYEVIDGQQRLTTVFILYRFLAKELKYSGIEEVGKDYSNLTLYHLYYQTRPSDYDALEKSGFVTLTNSDITDIDIAHVSNAYGYMNSWLYGDPNLDPECAAATFSLFSKDEPFTVKTVKDHLFNLLNNSNTNGSVQFIWYELGAGKDAIREFLSENKGKIKLTDTEKIRALFMQRSNFGSDIKHLKQLSIAKDWELIENTLHRNDFWSFISKDCELEDGRISIIFEYIFDNDSSLEKKVCQGDYLFRYYYQLFARNKKVDASGSASNYVDLLWDQVMDCYRMLQNWFYNPRVYNLVGLLVKHGYSIKQISDIYNRVDVLTNDDFIRALNQEIRKEIIDKIPISKEQADLGIGKEEEYINLFFNKPADKAKMPDLFRFINVREINNTIDNALADIEKEDDEKKKSDMKRSARDVMSHIYRFPYEALDVFGWDIEHIDSATTNSLTDLEEEKQWIKCAREAIGGILDADPSFVLYMKDYNDPKTVDKKLVLDKMVKRIHSIVGEEESDTQKNWIGNLTLLDCGTNRSYQNKIFAWKGDIIKKRIHSGVFVPVCTQNVFSKNYDGCTPDKWKWSLEDKKAYHQYILHEIQAFKKEFGDGTVDDNTNDNLKAE